MAYSDDHIALAAEYALGTLDADERALVETMMIVDHGFMEMVEAWDHRLSPLQQMVGAIDAPPHLWEKIRTAVELHGDQTPVVLPPVPEEPIFKEPVFEPVHPAETVDTDSPEQPDRRPELAAPGEPTITVGPREFESWTETDDVPQSRVVPLPAPRRRGGFIFGIFTSALAACLAAIVALQLYRPDLLPPQLRVKPKVQVVEVRTPAAPPPAQLVAVLQQNAVEPAFILTVDTATRNFTVRRVGVPPPPDKSFELWLVSDKLPRPRSLGVIGASEFTSRTALAAYDSDLINQAIFAVTVEPAGGSPTGNPTSNPIYAGKLIESVPAGGPGTPQ
ncbi:MAG: hypothetical protein EKK40_18310 [Bradyrhizobiaceae bacterium]|nr:MAG: hypothetical protein EKK40_18310 [Bradyrhizobiaceae bacterium]